MRRLLHSLVFRLTALNILVFSVILAIALVAVTYSRSRHIASDVDRLLAERSEHALHQILMHSGNNLLGPAGHEDPLHSHEFYFQIRGADSSVLRKSANLRNIDLPFSAAARLAKDGRRVIETLSDPALAALPEGEHGFRLLTVYSEEPGRAPFYLQTAASLHQYHHMLEDERSIVLITLGVSLLAVGLGSWFLASRALRPVRTISNELRKLTVDRLNQRLLAALPDGDLGDLVRNLNAMLDRLERGFRSHERFLAEVSHEMKTPVAVLLGQAQVISRQARTPEQYDEFVASVESEMRRLSETINSFLLLARANAGFPAALSAPVPLNDLIMRAVERAHLFASHREVHVEPRLMLTDGEEPELNGDEELLCSMVTNLLINAVRHSPVGGCVEIEARTDGGGIAISVRDRGPGIHPDQLERIFEPFVSVGTNGMKGTGLGLAIARSVADLHGGTVRAANRPGGGSEFTIQLPLHR